MYLEYLKLGPDEFVTLKLNLNVSITSRFHCSRSNILFIQIKQETPVSVNKG